MLPEYENAIINPRLKQEPISTEGYSSSDMSMYYSGTYILCNGEPVYVRDMDRSEANVTYLDADGREDYMCVPISSLKRFLVPQGIYQDCEGELFFYNYEMFNSYKKGIASHHIRLDGTFYNTFRAIYAMVYPSETPKSMSISPRLRIHNGKVYSFYNRLTVGSFKDGEIDTPFPSVTQRYLESRDA